jgi:hypothetical protein
MLVWHNANGGELVVTTTRKNSPFSCIVAAGDRDTEIFPDVAPVNRQ